VIAAHRPSTYPRVERALRALATNN
jgi:hypothetical protein